METISMSLRQRHRLEAFSRVRREEITLVKASELLGLSYRQTKRCYARYQKEGDKGLVHRLRGQPSNRQADVRQKRRILSLYEKKYADYGPTLAAECLRDEDGVTAGGDVAAMAVVGRAVAEAASAQVLSATSGSEGVLWRTGADGRFASRLV